ncbi:hypothetical protein [Tepidibacillus sp. HK-1]|uniref:hypothetical protein n=1 Tax=Tepidibacillus sp. HK-1 TaxID=1883407 RepID=UPI000853E24B|nr:hypothetical protein [Tepidibacillus sp. HK-1]GBF11069.1 hypothetical protein HK1_01087 [Tepidibacillus sp. HK-1]
MKKLVFILFFIFLVGCQNGSFEQKEINQKPKESIEETKKVKIEEKNTENEMMKQKLFDYAAYNGEKSINITIEGKIEPAEFKKVKFTSYGLYVPKILKENMFEDGNEFGFSIAEFISIRPIDSNIVNREIAEEFAIEELVRSPLTKDKNLMIFDEYLFSTINENGVRNDFFFYQHDKNQGTIVKFRYFQSNVDKVLPTFLEVIKHIRYVNES